MPVYNHWQHLETCIDSILCQDQPLDQVVIVNDASTQWQVNDILQRYAGIPTVEIIQREDNGGIVAAQNDGLARCNRDYVAFVDCDDVLQSDAVATWRSVSAAAPADYYFSSRTHIDDEGRQIGVYDPERLIATHPGGLSDLLLDHMVASHLKIIARGMLTDLGGFEPGSDGVQDWDIALKCSERGTLVHIPAPLYHHRIHNVQNSTVDRAGSFLRTNIIRRNALVRRGLCQSPPRKPDVDEADIGRIAECVMRAWSSPSSIYRSTEDVCLLIVTSSQVTLHTLSEARRLTVQSGDVIFVVLSRRANVGLLRHVVGLSSGFVVAFVAENQESIACAQWFNSYFDAILCENDSVLLGLLGICWPGCRLSSLRPGGTRSKDGRL